MSTWPRTNFATVGSLLLFASAVLQAQTSASAQGSVEIKALFPTHNPSRAMGGSVTFEPGARTAAVRPTWEQQWRWTHVERKRRLTAFRQGAFGMVHRDGAD